MPLTTAARDRYIATYTTTDFENRITNKKTIFWGCTDASRFGLAMKRGLFCGTEEIEGEEMSGALQVVL